MKLLTKSILCLCLLAASLTVFSGCQTAEGFGEDIENAGESIQDGVD